MKLPARCVPSSVRKKSDAITETFDRDYVCLRVFNVPPSIDNFADCEIGGVIRFLSAKCVKAA